MEAVRWKTEKVIDSHVHYREKMPLEHFQEIIRLAGYTGFNILGGRDQRSVEARKKTMPEQAFQFGMLDQKPEKFEAGDGAYLTDNIDDLMSWGYDGIKMMDGKPVGRRGKFPLDIDHDYYKPYWDKVEALDIPITIHCCDPIDYWDEDSPSSYADLAPQEDFFRQTIAVLERNPNLRVNFAHFLFMGPQLERLGDLFARFPKMRVDMAMAAEFLYYLSDDPEGARDFYIKWQDRILYGTDISDHNSLAHARSKAEVLRLFLETDETFENIVFTEGMGKEAPTGPNGRSELHGLSLPQEVLEKVLWKNFEVFVAEKPKPVG